jgi:hypothetical protein
VINAASFGFCVAARGAGGAAFIIARL